MNDARVQPWAQGLHLMWSFLGRGKSRPVAILLAVAWGTLSMMLLLAFGEGLKRQMSAGRLGLGQDPVVLWPGSTTKPWEGLKAGRSIRFLQDDVEALIRAVPEIDAASGEYTRWAVDLRWNNTSVSSHLTGISPAFLDMRSHHPAPGSRFFNDSDMREARRVLFIGPELKQRLFGAHEAVGQTVFVRGVPFTVVGVQVDKVQNSTYGGPDNDKASIPIPAFEAIFGQRGYNNLLYHVRDDADPEAVKTRAREVLARRQHFDPTDESAVSVWDTRKNHDEGDKIMGGIQIFLGLVGAMTLLVAGVGLANMLFVMVTRRTREIGLMMAMGARRGAVLSQIVGESLVLAGIGGYLGIGLSWLICEGAQRLPEKGIVQYLGRPTLSIPLGLVTVVVLVGIGCLSGWLPGARAARLNPVEALRHE